MSDLTDIVKKQSIVLNRLIRKANVKHMSSFLTEFGMHGFIRESEVETGILFRDMFPVNGTVTHVYLFIGEIVVSEREKRAADLLVAIESKSLLTVTKGIKVGEGMQEAATDLVIGAGDRLIVRCSKPMRDVWYALTMSPIPHLKSVNSSDSPELIEAIEVPE